MRLLFEFLRLFLTPRASLVAENLALRQQLVALRRESPRPRRAHGRLVARPVLGGLHHVYDRAA
jgi:hypothetical protein